jgi:hypothetical protein
MNRLIPLSAAAGVVACVLAAGSAQAAPVASGVLDKLATANNGTSAVQQVYWRRHHRYWRYRYYRRHCGWRCHYRWWY